MFVVRLIFFGRRFRKWLKRSMWSMLRVAGASWRPECFKCFSFILEARMSRACYKNKPGVPRWCWLAVRLASWGSCILFWWFLQQFAIVFQRDAGWICATWPSTTGLKLMRLIILSLAEIDACYCPGFQGPSLGESLWPQCQKPCFFESWEQSHVEFKFAIFNFFLRGPGPQAKLDGMKRKWGTKLVNSF